MVEALVMQDMTDEIKGDLYKTRAMLFSCEGEQSKSQKFLEMYIDQELPWIRSIAKKSKANLNVNLSPEISKLSNFSDSDKANIQIMADMLKKINAEKKK